MPSQPIDGAILRRLGGGVPLATVMDELAVTRAEWDTRWRDELHRRVPAVTGERLVRGGTVGRGRGRTPSSAVLILRDARGLPHVRATTDADLFFGYGYAMAQDRLFQMDLRRRRAQGRLAEVLGLEGLEADRIARTIGLHLAADAEALRLDDETYTLLDAFAAGVNAHVAEVGNLLPIEFDLLGYRPDPWTVAASTACAMSWRWQLTGRPLVVVAPELVKRTLGDGPLYRRFLDAQREADGVSIVPRGAYPTGRVGVEPLPHIPAWAAAQGRGHASVASDDEPKIGPFPVTSIAMARAEGGSNDWVVAGSRSQSGKPLLASDPHLPYEAASSMYEVHLQGGSFDVAGAGLVGMPGVSIGRNRHLAWGFTNNICPLRDLYAESPDTVEALRTESIEIRGADPVGLEIRGTRHGPVIDELLPAFATGTGPVSMRWAGVLPCDWTGAQLRLSRAQRVGEAMEAVRGWRVPTFSVVLADTDGRIGYVATGAVPIREVPERGYRPGADATHDWAGSIPREGMPQVVDPPPGYLVTANNRPAPDDFPYPLSGTWDEGMRSRRIGALVEALTPGNAAAMGRIQTDTAVHRAPTTVPALAEALTRLAAARSDSASTDHPEDAAERRTLARAGYELAAWDGMAAPDSRGATIYEVLFTRWTQAVARERLGENVGTFVAPWAAGLAAALLVADDEGWFTSGRRDEVLLDVASAGVRELTTLLGPDVATWRWGRLHRLRLRHPLAGRGALAELLAKPPVEVGGDSWTINNSGFPGGAAGRPDATAFEPSSGAGFRMVVDLGESPPRAWTVTAESQSGHPGSAHWNDQLDDFVRGRAHRVALDPIEVDATAVDRLTIVPEERP